MGQKSNTLTVRSKFLPNLSFLNLDRESNIFLRGWQYSNFLEKFLDRKNILTVNKTVHMINNTCFINFVLFFRTAKLTNYRKKTTRLSHQSRQPAVLTKKNNLTNLLLSKSLLTSRINTVALNFKSVNILVKDNFLKEYYQKTSRFMSVLFLRKFSLYIDFLKLSVLFKLNIISAQILLRVLGQIFRVLPKRKHTRFLYFLKHIFNMFLIKVESTSVDLNSNIQGIKFVINGKLQGKTRASSSCIQVGAVPIQSLDKNIEFSKLHVYTLYGVFGFKIWIYRA